MNPLLRIAHGIDRLIDWIGRSISWLTLTTVIMTFLVVLLRYAFDFGRIWIQETYLWMHAMVFMLGAAWTLKQDGHVRVDIFYLHMTPRTRCWIDLLGTVLLLLPTCVFILWVSLPYVQMSWALHEGSRETGGIPAVYLLKTLIPAMAGLLLLQGLSLIIHNLARLRGHEAMPARGHVADE